MDRIILHCDCNSFFASVEMARNPAYKNVPMAVCGSSEDRHGIVLAKNELAKKYGIVTAETVFSAKKKCPSLVIAEPHFRDYVAYSHRVSEVFSRFTDMIEPFGIDESWLDVTASRRFFGNGREIAERIRTTIKEEIGITVSIGVSFNKVFAKLGSDYKKPDAITEITRENFKEIVYPLPVSSLLFVGKRTDEALCALGIKTIGELAAASPSLLAYKLGKGGELLSKYARGEDDSPVEVSHEEAKSISNGFTFRHDLVGRDECRAAIDYLSEEIGTRLRKNGQKCATVSLQIKDEYLRVVQRQRPIAPPTDIAAEISAAAYCALCDVWTPERPVRMITVAAANLLRSEDFSEQLDLFSIGKEERREKTEKKENTVDIIRQKYGNESIVKASVIDTDFGIYEKKDKKKKSES